MTNCPVCQRVRFDGRACPAVTCKACGTAQCGGCSKCAKCLHVMPSWQDAAKGCTFKDCGKPALVHDAPGRHKRICREHAEHVVHRPAFGRPGETVWARIVRLAHLQA
uniref:Uncharacterized protein n=1 Tax=uncultured Caudovirales phage TaxID=2100421 RepID=A0A6J5LAF0_9CAUD|nr:hypothetical protein UFOVP114_81 [uncultured Caudovirales phage]